MQSLQSWVTRFTVIGAVFLALLAPQGQAHAETCYDASKNVVPCPKSGYVLTQEALKAAGPSATPLADTPTETLVPPTPTNTNTPVPPTPTPTETSTPVPAAAAAAVVPPPPPTDSAPPKEPPLMLLGILALGGLGLGTILLTQSRRHRRGANQGPDQVQTVKIDDFSFSTDAPAEEAPHGPVRVDWMNMQHPINPDQLHTYEIDGVRGVGMVVIRDPATGAIIGSRGGWIDRDGKEHTYSPDAQNDYIKKEVDSVGDMGEVELSDADIQASLEKQDILNSDLSQADLDESQHKREILEGGALPTEKTILTAVEQDYINGLAHRSNIGIADVPRKDGSPGGSGGPDDARTAELPRGTQHETGHTTTGPDDSTSSGRGHVVSSTPSTGSTGGDNDGKGDGKVSGKGDNKEGKGYGASDGGDGGTDGKKETGDGKGSGTDGEKPKPTKGDSSMPGPDGGGDGNTGGRGIFRPGQGFAGGTGPDPNIERIGRPGGVGDLNTGPGQTGGRSTGEPDLESNSGGDINAAHPGAGGRLAPSEGVGTDVGDPASG